VIYFLIHTDRNYLPYAKRCIRSLQKHSTYKPILYGYGEDFSGDAELQGVGVRETPRPTTSLSPLDACNARLKSCVHALEKNPEDVFIFMDADMFAIQNIDDFITQNVSRLGEYPLFLTYLHDNLIHWNIDENGTETCRGHGDEAAEYLGITPRGPHAERGNGFIDFTLAGGLFMFDVRSKPFLEEALKACDETQHLRESDEGEPRLFWDDRAFSNERIMNALFWKYDFRNHLPLTWVSKDYDNSFLSSLLQTYIAQGFDVVYSCENRDDRHIGLNQVLFLHGTASVPDRDVFNRLKSDENIPLIAEMKLIGNPAIPTMSYDKFKLFAPPFFSTTSVSGEWSIEFLSRENNPDFTLNFPFREGTTDRGIHEMLFLFLLDGMVIDACNFGLPHLGAVDEYGENARNLFLDGKKWWVWGHPVSVGCKPAPYGWASTLQSALENFSVQIYA